MEHEWELERTLEANATSAPWWDSAPAFVARRFFLLLAAVAGCFQQQAVRGWCPPIQVFRHLGVWTAGEIDVEWCALKAIRGEVDDLRSKVRGSVVDAGVGGYFGQPRGETGSAPPLPSSNAHRRRSPTHRVQAGSHTTGSVRERGISRYCFLAGTRGSG
ncbi:MAG: hypothetical protein H8K10_17005 [Nitrospira sp.]|nr:hypothetical protein [Nitrospira sp.]